VGGDQVSGRALLFNERKHIVDVAMKHRLPSLSMAREFAELGGLMAYGASLTDLQRRSATYVDKILKGAKPADLPVEQPTKFEFVINLKTAKAHHERRFCDVCGTSRRFIRSLIGKTTSCARRSTPSSA
jgi:ABC transporter substrate binding protein